MLCPFCGRETLTTDFCNNCGVRFNKEIREIAWEESPYEDKIGPVSTKVAKRLLFVGMFLLLVLFFVITESQGNGLLSMI